MGFTTSKRGVAWRKRAGGTGGGVQPFFQDQFAGGQLNDANGFDWAPASWGQRQTSVVEDPDSPGAYALRFSYHNADDATPAHRIPFNYDNSEMYFDLGQDVSELWVEYGWRPPAGLQMTDQNKAFILFRDVYSTPPSFQCAIEFWTQVTPAPSQSVAKIRMMRRQAASDGGTGSLTHWIPETNRAVFISPTGPVFPGQWNQMRIHLRLSSGFDVPDGVFEVFANGVVVESYTNQKLWNFDTSLPDCKMRRGYFMGASNGYHTAPTHWYINNVRFYISNPGW